MKTVLSLQLILQALMTIASIALMAAAFMHNSIALWKAFTIIFVIASAFLVKLTLKELKQ